MLFIAVLALVVVGGFVRLSGSGLSIPGWPVIELEHGRWTLLPPIAEADWQVLREHFEADQERLRDDIRRGAVGIGSLGRVPEDAAAFKTMFVIEWSHRFVAAIVGLIAAGCLVVVLRHRELRRRVGGLLGGVATLIVAQALLGGALVRSGTATHWLFLHLGTAALILAGTLWTILRLIAPGTATGPMHRDRPLVALSRVALVVAWLQILLGALVAGSRGGASSSGTSQFVSTWPKMADQWLPSFLWESALPLSWNLLDNALLHQWVHRWFALVVAATVVALCWLALRRPGARLHLAARAAATFLAMQVVLGLANVALTHPTFVALSHLVMAMFLLASLVLIAFDAVAVPAPAPIAATSAPHPSAGWILSVLRLGRDLLILTKYRITGMALFTGYAAIAVQGTHATDWAYIWPCLLALFLTGGCANTLNQIFEKDKDAVMDRTKARRPLPSGRIGVRAALVFAIAQLVIALAILIGFYASWLAAGLALFTVVYYSFFYTLWLKPRHYLNIVIGGVPGAMGPLIAWAAMTGTLAVEPLVMFLIIFLWTPPHVWALAIRLKDDYARAGIPMLPVVKGVDETTRQIFIYTIVLVLGTLFLPYISSSLFARGPIYTALAFGLGAVWLVWTAALWLHRPVMPTMPLFRFSIVYIGALFLGLVIDARLAAG